MAICLKVKWWNKFWIQLCCVIDKIYKLLDAGSRRAYIRIISGGDEYALKLVADLMLTLVVNYNPLFVIAGPKRWLLSWLCFSIQWYNRIIIPILAVMICTCILHFLVYSFLDLWVFMQTLGLCHVSFMEDKNSLAYMWGWMTFHNISWQRILSLCTQISDLARLPTCVWIRRCSLQYTFDAFVISSTLCHFILFRYSALYCSVLYCILSPSALFSVSRDRLVLESLHLEDDSDILAVIMMDEHSSL